MAPDVTSRARAADDFLQERRDELIEFACKLVATPSPNPPGDDPSAAELVATRLEELGVGHVRLAGCDPAYPNVLAQVDGRRGGKKLLLNGHLDTKPPGEEAAWQTPPWDPTIRDGVLTGLGAADMKGAVAAMVYAAGAVAAAGPGGGLALAFTADEETGGTRGAGWLADQGFLAADAAVIGEPSGIERDWEAIHLISRGAAIFRIRVRGTQMHSSLSDRLPSVNASVEMARLMTRMHRERRSILTYTPHPLVDRGPTFNVGLITAGGIGHGVVPGAAEFLSDVRALPGMTREGIEADLTAFLERVTADEPQLDADLEITHWIPACEIEPSHPLVEALMSACGEVLGSAPRFDYFPGGTDAPYLQLEAGIPTVPSFGPGLLPQAHAPNESIAVDRIVEAARIYALAAARFWAR